MRYQESQNLFGKKLRVQECKLIRFCFFISKKKYYVLKGEKYFCNEI